MKGDPLQLGRGARGRTPGSKTPATDATVSVRGELSEEAVGEVARLVAQCFQEGAASVSVELNEGVAGEAASFDALAAKIMEQRAGGRHVQVAVHEAALHAALRNQKDARDWLMPFAGTRAPGARRALHLDGPSGKDPAG